MFDYQRAKDIAEKVISDGINSITTDQEQFARKVYKELNGKPFKGCTNCWTDLIILTTLKIKNNNINPNQTTTMNKFILKPGKMIQLHGFDPITEKNITDDIAKAILKQSRSHSKSFATLPDGWEGMVDKFVPVVVKPSPSEAKRSAAATVTAAPKAAKEKANDTEETDKEAAKEKLDAMSKKELKEICETKDFPEKEYKKMNKEELVDYILERL